jgi:hypothetical protein
MVLGKGRVKRKKTLITISAPVLICPTFTGLSLKASMRRRAF